MNKLEMLPDLAKDMGGYALLVAFALVHTEDGGNTQTVTCKRLAQTTQLSADAVMSALHTLMFAGLLDAKTTQAGTLIVWHKDATGQSYKAAFGGAP